ncbi:hypothetical protein CFC35_39170 [Streptomyces sp. FBKL.4005]|nr:hypothetical protein CFC35_39170 [Streptomyces sp. FBKL.4005]
MLALVRGGVGGPLLERAASRLDTGLTLDDLAERAGLSSRTLARRFAEQLGTSRGERGLVVTWSGRVAEVEAKPLAV